MSARRQVVGLCAVIMTASGCVGREPTSNAPDDQVYAAALDSVYGGPGGFSRLVIQDSTSTWFSWPDQDESLAVRLEFHRPRLPGVDARMAGLLIASRSRAVRIPEALAIRIPYSWMTTSEVRRLVASRGRDWGTFANHNLGTPGITQLSRVVYSEDGTRALLYLAEVCMRTCGHGEYITLQRRDRTWVVAGRSQDWVS